MAAEDANLVVREGVWVENADFGTHLVPRDLVERSILVYGKWGQIGDLGGAIYIASIAYRGYFA